MMKLFGSFILLLPLFWASVASAVSAETIVSSFYEGKVVRGLYTQTHKITSYPKAIQTKGSFVIAPKRVILWEEKGLFPTKTIYRDSSFHIYQDIGKDRVFRASSPITNVLNRVLWALFSGDFIGLRQDFIIQTTQTDDRWSMSLFPKSSLAKAIIKSIHILGTPLPVRLECSMVCGDVTLLHMYQIEQSLGTLTSEENAIANP